MLVSRMGVGNRLGNLSLVCVISIAVEQLVFAVHACMAVTVIEHTNLPDIYCMMPC